MTASASKISSLRLLVLAPEIRESSTDQERQLIPLFLEKLTGSTPSEDVRTFAGYTSHDPLHLKTKYYDTNVSIWCDELPPVRDSSRNNTSLRTDSDSKSNHNDNDEGDSAAESTSLAHWKETMTSSAAIEVRDVIGAIALVLTHHDSSTSSSRSSAKTNSAIIEQWLPYIEAATTLRDETESETGRDVASLVIVHQGPSASKSSSRTVGQSTSSNEKTTTSSSVILQQLEDECLGELGVLGWDFVEYDGYSARNEGVDESKGGEDKQTTQNDERRNEFGEKTGFARVIEVLSGVNWLASTNSAHDDDNDSGNEDEFGLDEVSSTLGRRPDIRSSLAAESGLERALPGEHDFQNEMMGLKLAMLNIDGEDDGDIKFNPFLDRSDTNGLNGEVATTTTSTATNTKSGKTMGKDDDVWAGLDAQDEIRNRGDEIQVDHLQGLMERVIAIREAGSDMTPDQRERFAKREIAKIMKELG